MPLEDFIIRVYCLVDDTLNEVLNGRRLRQRGPSPALSDAEVLTMELVGAYLGFNEEEALWAYFSRHWRPWFPALGSRTAFTRQAANLWWAKAQLQERWADTLGVHALPVHVVDGFPLPVCHFRRAHFSRCFTGEAAFGYCATKRWIYYGFKMLLLIDARGAIAGFSAVPANVDERDALEAMDVSPLKGLLLGDKGYLRKELTAHLAAGGLCLQTPVRTNMPETRPAPFLDWMSKQRRLIETVIGQLSQRFHIQVNRARDRWHLTSRLYRKFAAHTLCTLINWQDGRSLLDLDGLVTI